jgi:hypothetical protein
MVGYLPAVSRNSNADRAALNENVRVPITPSAATATNTPGITAPDSGDQTVGNVAITISKSKHVPVRWNGEETKGLQNAGTFSSIMAQRLYQGIRALVNEMETDLHSEVFTHASRAYGTAATAPFGTAADMTDFAGVARILDENGAPVTDRQLVLGHAAIANLRGKQSGLFKVNEAGSADMLRNGMTDRLQNFAIRHSNAVGVHTKGAASGQLINNASGEIVGETTLTLDTITVNTTGILAGDIITHASDSVNKYVVNTGLAATAGDIVIGDPGLLIAAANNDAVAIGNSYTPNMAFDRSAIIFASRMPAMPEGGDMAVDTYQLVDDKTGLAFEVALYKQFLQNVIHVRAAWGQKAIKPNHIATLIG